MGYATLRCDPALLAKDLSERVYVVTGANSGVGLETARQLVKQGATVVMACRRVEAGEEAAADFATGEGAGTVQVMALDLGSLASVRAFAAAFAERHARLDALVCNAGLVSGTRKETADGFEMMFGVNHLGHYLLTELLLPTLRASAPSRVVCLSSCVSALSTAAIDFDDLQFEARDWGNGTPCYGSSKLANAVHARILARRMQTEGADVTAVSVHPGWARSQLAAGMMPLWIQNVLLVPFSSLLTMMTSYDAAQPTLHCLLADDVPAHAGEYYSQCSRLYPQPECRPGGWPMRHPNPAFYDDEVADRLDAISRKLVGLDD